MRIVRINRRNIVTFTSPKLLWCLAIKLNTKSLQNAENRGEALSGALAALPILPAVVPFGMLYGALAIAEGFTPVETMMATAMIFAGASQYLMLEMLGQHVGAVAIVLAVLAVNFRHILYSAALGRRMGSFERWQKAVAFALMVDPAFAAAEQRARTVGLQAAWYFGYAGLVYVLWLIANIIGVIFGGLIEEPSRFGLDFILPLYFLGIVMGFRHSAGFLPVVAASIGGSLLIHATLGAPYHIFGGAMFGLALAALRSPCQAK